MKIVLKLLFGTIALIAYEFLLDGTGIGMKQRWAQIKKWAQRWSNTETGVNYLIV